MTRDEVLAMEPGYQLDNLVAQNMFGFFEGEEFAFVSSSGTATKWRNQSGNPQMVPKYSTDIAATWGVVERLKSEGISVAMWSRRAEHPWYVQIGKPYEMPIVEAATLPEAICKAALLAALDRG